MYGRRMSKMPMTFRIEAKLLARLEKACDKAKNPYAPTQTQVVERGIELALRELERRK